ncbi:MAG: ribonuclease D [Solirubrobacteraceae bacterium]
MDTTLPTTLARDTDIAHAAAAAQRAGRLGIDTEFMSEGRYRALLCLVQVAVADPEGEGEPDIYLIDSLAGVDVAPLAALLGDPSVEIVLHAGRQDVAILRRAWRTELNNIFDTQIAAGFAGASAQAGYGNLLGSVLGQRVGKTASYTRWDARPLTAEQLGYAAEDVAHLLALADEIQRRLQDSGRLGWAREECRRLETATDERDPETAWERLPRIGQLDPRSRAVARALAAWRERTASELDRPVGSIVADPALVELAKRRPATTSALEQIRGLHPPTIKRRGDAILNAIERGLEAPPIPRDEARGRSEPGDAPLIALAEALLRARALEAGLAYELIASRAELELIVGAARRGDPEPDVRTLDGWRRELVGDDLRNLLAGLSAVSVGRDRRLELTRSRAPA